jgi:hypothetical protein
MKLALVISWRLVQNWQNYLVVRLQKPLVQQEGMPQQREELQL